MATQIYSSGNYVIVDDGSKVYEYAKGHTLYTFIDGVFYIKEITQGQFKVTTSDIEADLVTDNTNIPYTLETFTTFLRENTGFKTAPGGSGATPVGATLMKTGQTTSYRTGDDGDLEAGRATSFTVLASNNPFGNTNRFTDELGGQTYTNNIVIDWSTYNGSNVLGWDRTQRGPLTWENSIDSALLASVGVYTSGWRLPNIMEYASILNWVTVGSLNYAPFNVTSSSRSFWSSSCSSSTRAYQCSNSGTGILSHSLMTTTLYYLIVRTFTVTGTTLT